MYGNPTHSDCLVRQLGDYGSCLKVLVLCGLRSHKFIHSEAEEADGTLKVLQFQEFR